MKSTNRLTFFLHVCPCWWICALQLFIYFIIVSSIVRYLFSIFLITSFEETPKRGAFTIHDHKVIHMFEILWEKKLFILPNNMFVAFKSIWKLFTYVHSNEYM